MKSGFNETLLAVLFFEHLYMLIHNILYAGHFNSPCH